MAFKGITAFILNNGEGGGGGEPSGNYNDLTNHPQINGNELIGNKTADQLGLLSADTDIPTKLSDLDEDTTHRTVTDSEKQSWNNKVDSVAGKGLSTNDYTDGDKEDVAKIDGLVGTVSSLSSSVGIVSGKVRTLEGEMLSVQDTLDTKVDKETGKGLSTNDYSNADKAIVDGVTTALAGKVDTSSVGTASTKNSTSVVTESTDLVESGAVKDIIGWGNKNLFNKNDVENGIINESGAISIVGEWKSSKFIKVTPSEKYIISGLNISYASSGGFAFYNSAKTFVSGGGINVFKNTPITIPDNVEYIRFSLVSADLDTAQLEKGSTATAYEPYYASVEEYCASKQDVVDTVGWCSTVLDKGVIASANVNNEGTINNSTYSLAYFKVQAGKKYTVSNCNDFTDVNLILAYFTEKPVQRAVSYDNSRTQIVRETAISQTVTAPIDGYIAIRMNDAANNIRFEEGEVVTQSVEDKKCDNSTIAPTENNSTTSQAYAVGSHAIRNGAFITWKNAKAQGETINDASDYTAGNVANILNLKRGSLILEPYHGAGSGNNLLDVFEVNGIVTIWANIYTDVEGAFTPAGYTKIATVTGVDLPPKEIRGVISYNNSTASLAVRLLRSGALEIYNYTSEAINPTIAILLTYSII